MRTGRLVACALLTVVLSACGSANPAAAGFRQIRATAAPSAVDDAQGEQWAGTTSSNRVRWSGGRTVCAMGRVGGTASEALYRCARVGVRGLSVSVPPGLYGVTLSFAETLGANPSERVFDVRAEGRTVIKGLDISRVAGQRRVHHELLVVPVREGTLRLAFVARRGRPLLNTVSVGRLRDGPSPPGVVWRDEFGGPAGRPPDPHMWQHELGATQWGSHELQDYTRDPANAATDGRGHLAIVARVRDRAAGVSYTSARLTTQSHTAIHYGDVEARIAVPSGQGLWPGFWALGTDVDKAGWPQSGEIDILEVIGSKPWKTHGSIHGPTPDGDEYRVDGTAMHRPTLGGAWHVYGIRWLPDAIQFRLDGRPYRSITRDDLPAGRRWVFDRSFFLLLSLAVGGDWPGPPGADTRFPATMLVDWVRVIR